MFTRLRERRLVYRIRIFCLVLAGAALFVAAPMQAGSTRAAEGKVRVELRGKTFGAYGQKGNGGRFVLTGALSDRGGYATDPNDRLRRRPLVAVRMFHGAKGTIRIAIPQGARRLPNGRYENDWEIVGGTKGYAGLRGGGTEEWWFYPATPRRMRVRMTGTVWWLNK